MKLVFLYSTFRNISDTEETQKVDITGALKEINTDRNLAEDISDSNSPKPSISSTSPVTVRGIPLSVVEDESAEISRKIAQGLHEKSGQASSEVDITPINTVQSDLSQISGTIIVQAGNTGKNIFQRSCIILKNYKIKFCIISLQ